MASRYLLLFFASTVLSSPVDPLTTETINISPRDASSYRLPEGAVEVSYYEIQLQLTEETFTTAPNSYEGRISITFKSLQTTNEIKLHATRIEVLNVNLVDRDSNEIDIVDSNLNTTTDILTLTTAEAQPLTAETFYQLSFEFIGILRTDEANGFFRSSYINAAGQTRYLGSTQLEPARARKVFPCFDEPGLKAEFNISIRHPVEYNAIGNMEETRTVDPDDPNFVITAFEITPPMPTYLVAFVVSDMTCSQGEDIESGIAHYVCSREEVKNDRVLANEYGPKITWAMEEFTGVKFNDHRIGKIHHVAVPQKGGAMENWGLITYGEPNLLWNPQQSSNRNKHNAITTIAHELAHFWFGNYVTCGWWSNIFLNEGFATYFEYTISQIVDSTLETDKQFVISEMQTILVSDASPGSAPLSSPANTQAEISGRFGTISYYKGGSIFRMVDHFMGRENFKRGLNAYLTTKQFGSATPEDLWTALQPFTSVPLLTVMENWVYKAGFPILNVASQGSTVTITQSRFLSTEDQPSTEDQWHVPIAYTTSSTPNKFQETLPSEWLTPGNTVTITLPTVNDWIILNNQRTGFYRVDYDATLWAKIRTALNRPGFDGIHEINRVQLVDDLYNLVRYGRRSFAELLELYTFLRKDTSYYTWSTAFTAFSVILQGTTDEELVRFLTEYISELLEVVYNSVPFTEIKDDDQIYTLTKALVVPWACRLGIKDCADRALGAFARYKSTREKLDKNLKSTILCNGLRHSTDVEDWYFLYNDYLSLQFEEPSTILTALGCFKNANTLRGFLNESIYSDVGISRRDASSVFSSVYSGNPEGVDIALDFLIENYPAIVNYFNSLDALNNLFTGLTSRFTRTEQTDKFREFIETANLGTAADAALSALDNALNNLEWTAKLEEELRSYFAQDEVTGPNTTPPPPTTTTTTTTTTPSTQPNATTPTPDTGGSGGSSLAVGLTTFMATILVLCYQFL